MKYLRNFVLTLSVCLGVISTANAEETKSTLEQTQAVVATMMETLKKCDSHACTMEFYNKHASPDLLATINASDATTQENMLKGAKPMAEKFIQELDKFEASIEEISEDKVSLVYKAKDVNNKQENKFSFIKINGEWKLG